MLTKKQELFFKLIVNCYYEEKKYPNLKTLNKKVIINLITRFTNILIN